MHHSLSFYACRFQKRKKTDNLTVLIALLGSERVNAVRKMFVKLTPGRNPTVFKSLRSIMVMSLMDYQVLPNIILFLKFVVICDWIIYAENFATPNLKKRI